MLSKVKIWDLNFSKIGLDLSQAGLIPLVVTDPYIERILKDKIPRENHEIRIFIGNEITQNFIDENFVNLSLFSQASHFLILNAELIPNEVLQKMFKELIQYQDSSIFLFFAKANKSISDVLKKSEINCLEIEEFKFWDAPKMLHFLAKELQVKLDAACVKFLLENIEHTVEAFYTTLNLIKLNFADEIDLNKLKVVIVKERFDFFELLDIYHENRRKFYYSLDKKLVDFEWMREFSVSMQSHLAKVLNPSEISKKEKLSKYDMNIIRWSEMEPRQEMKAELMFFHEVEMLAKSHDLGIKEKIRIKMLK